MKIEQFNELFVCATIIPLIQESIARFFGFDETITSTDTQNKCNQFAARIELHGKEWVQGAEEGGEG